MEKRICIMKKLALLFVIGVLFIGGCGKQQQAEKVSQQETQKHETQEEKNTENIELTESEKSFFSELPDEFYFSSGAGAWRTELFLQDDGSFNGQYSDSDMGSMGEEYPNGTVYICEFECF